MSAVVRESFARLRPMRDADLAEVMRIETSAYEFPWTLGIFQDCLRFGYLCQVYDSPRGILGYGIMSVGVGECHLLNICIAPRHQRHGHATCMIAQLLDMARERRARMALLEVRVSNRGAYRLYTKLGFNEIGMRRGYYPARKGREDAIVLAREL
jgi:ribosomal-protein-alanine N-acetyltransferase